MTALVRMDVPTMIMWILIVGAVIGVFYFVGTNLFKGKKGVRLDALISKRRGELGRQQLEGLNKPSSIRASKTEGIGAMMQKLFSKLNLQDMLSSKDIREDLSRAGVRGRSAVAIYLGSRGLGLIGGAVAALVIVGLWKKFPYPEPSKYLFYGLGALIGFYMPKILLTNIVQKRQTEMTAAFPDTLDLLVICVEAGLGIEAAFARVTAEIGDTSPVLAQELGLTSAELAYLGDRRMAYVNFANRTGLPAAKALSQALIQSEQYGTPVGVALKVLSQEKRHERMSAAERKAASLPAKLTVPMIIFFLPVLFIVVIGPAAMQIGK